MSEALSSSVSILEHYLDHGFNKEQLMISAAKGEHDNVEPPKWVSPSYADLMLEIGGSLVSKIKFDNIDVQEFLGRGFTWTVHSGIWNDDGNRKLVALKFLNLDIDGDDMSHLTWDRRTREAFAAAESEIRILSHKTIRSNANIVTLLGITFQVHPIGSKNELLALPVLVEELAFLTREGHPATLSEDIMTNPVGLDPVLKMSFLLDIAKGLLDLHQLNIVHSDLKPSNILLFPRSSGGAIAKISDFGFCQSLDEEGPAQGNTPYWAAPECLPEADDNMKQWRSSTSRDLFSFGLLIWFIFFEEGPFGPEDGLNYADMVREKLAESMKTKIDKQLLLRYRWVSQDSAPLENGWLPKRLFEIMTDGSQQEVELELQSLNDHLVNGTIEEQMRNSRKDWHRVKSFADGYAVLQIMFFFMSFFLVKDPQLRVGLRFFIEMANSKLFHKIAMINFIGLSTRDHLWQTLFNPNRRQLVIDISDDVFRSGNFLHLITKLCIVRLNRDHNISRLGKEHRLSMSTHFSKPLIFSIAAFQNAPPCIPIKVFQCLIAKASSSFGTEYGTVYLQIGTCHIQGFGTIKSESAALDWLLKPANAGQRIAQRMILSLFSEHQLPEELKYVKLVDWLWRDVSPRQPVLPEHYLSDEIEDFRAKVRPVDLGKRFGYIRDYLLKIADHSTFIALKLEQRRPIFAWKEPEYGARLKENLAGITILGSGKDLWEDVDAAIRTEDLSLLRTLISQFPQLLTQENRKASMLHYAVLLSSQTVVRMLVFEHHMNPSHADDLGLSAIALAICCWQDSTSNLSEFVVQARTRLSDLNFPILLLLSIYTDSSGETTNWVGSMASMSPVREIIGHGFAEESSEVAPFLPFKQAIGPCFVDAALVWAIWANNHNALYWLVEIGANVNKRFKDIHYLTPLHCASERMKPLLVATLLVGGASPDATASQGRTPLHLACSTYQGPRAEYGTCSRVLVGEALSDSGLCGIHDPPHFDPKWGLHVLIDDHSPEQRWCCQSLVVKLLLHCGASVDARDSIGRTPLAYSIGTKAFRISVALLNADPPADINSKNDLGLTPLGEACELFRCPERARFCLELGADVHIKDELGRTPLFIAARNGNLELCRMFVDAGADIGAVDVQNDNCLLAAIGSHSWKCAEYLLTVVESYEQDGRTEILSTCDYEGLNCLGYCVILGSKVPEDLAIEALSLYAAVGILDAANASGYTPLHLAIAFRSRKWVMALLNLDADPTIPDKIYGWTPTFFAALEPLQFSMEIIKFIMDSGKFIEDPEELMGWRIGALIFWLQSTLYLEGLPPEYHEIADRMRRLTIPHAKAAGQRESKKRKIHYQKDCFEGLIARLLERKGLLRWKVCRPAIEAPPFDIFTNPDNSYLRDSVVTGEEISDGSRRDNRVVRWAWEPSLDNKLGKTVWIYDANGRFRRKTLVHLMARRNWRVWAIDEEGVFHIKTPEINCITSLPI